MYCSDCGGNTTTTRASREKPYRFLGSGLTNVYLAGIDLEVCDSCGMDYPRIPQIPALRRQIVLALCKMPKPLSGRELKFVRKAVGYRALKFAALLGMDNAHLSRAEGKSSIINPRIDKLARAIVLLAIGAPRAVRTVLLEEIEDLPQSFPKVFFPQGQKWAFDSPAPPGR